MAAVEDLVYIGVHGAVMALDRATGQELWRAALKGRDYANLTLDGDQLLASTKGEVFCLDPLTGAPRWHNPLPGMGWGLVTMVTRLAPSAPIVPEMSFCKRDQEAAASASLAGI